MMLNLRSSCSLVQVGGQRGREVVACRIIGKAKKMKRGRQINSLYSSSAGDNLQNDVSTVDPSPIRNWSRYSQTAECFWSSQARKFGATGKDDKNWREHSPNRTTYVSGGFWSVWLVLPCSGRPEREDRQVPSHGLVRRPNGRGFSQQGLRHSRYIVEDAFHPQGAWFKTG